MASTQCYKPVDQTQCQQQQEHQRGSMAQEKVWYSETRYTDDGVTKSQGCYSETQYQNKPEAHVHTHNTGSHSWGHKLTSHHEQQGQCQGQTNGHKVHHHGHQGMACNKKRGEHKRGIFQRIKDHISGDSSSSDSSDSESEGGKCHNRKN